MVMGSIADAHTRRVKGGIGNGGRNADDADLTNPFHPEGI